MSAKVEVLVEQLKNVLIASIQVVANREVKKSAMLQLRRIQNSLRYKQVR